MVNKENIVGMVMIIFPMMFYYTIEALFVGVFINGVWKLTLQDLLGAVTYIQVVGFYWIVKMLLFDIVELTAMTSVITEENIIDEEFDERKF